MSAANKKIPRTVRGKRPEFFPSEDSDLLMSMVMVLAEEFSVLQTRIDVIETVAQKKNLFLDHELEGFTPDEAFLTRQEKRRQEFLGRLFYVMQQKKSEAAGNDTAERFAETIRDIAAS